MNGLSEKQELPTMENCPSKFPFQTNARSNFVWTVSLLKNFAYIFDAMWQWIGRSTVLPVKDVMRVFLEISKKFGKGSGAHLELLLYGEISDNHELKQH